MDESLERITTRSKIIALLEVMDHITKEINQLKVELEKLENEKTYSKI